MSAHQPDFKTLVETAQEWIWETDAQGRLIYSNPAVEHIIGYKPEEIVGRLRTDFLAEEDKEKSKEIVAKCTEEKIGWKELVFRWQHKNGSLRTLECNAVPKLLSDGTFDGYYGFYNDVTKREEVEHALSTYAESLKKSNLELEQFAYVISHDLQAPLRMISSYTQLLAKRYQGKLDQNADDFIKFIVDGASRMSDLIKDLLTYSRLATRAEPFKPVEANQILTDTLDTLKMAMEESNAAVTADPLPAIMADATQLRQLFQNLIGNAIKFHGQEPPKIHIKAEKNEKNWLFSVTDNGIGIPQDQFERIFIIFQRLHTEAEYPGTGMGLTICKKIVERHGGRLWVESKEGQGSTFFFTLPVAPGQ